MGSKIRTTEAQPKITGSYKKRVSKPMTLHFGKILPKKAFLTLNVYIL